MTDFLCFVQYQTEFSDGGTVTLCSLTKPLFIREKSPSANARFSLLNEDSAEMFDPSSMGDETIVNISSIRLPLQAIVASMGRR
jgi:hypothetical protein